MKLWKESLASTLWAVCCLVFLSCEETEPFKPNHNPEIVKFGLLGTGVQSGEFGTLICQVSDADDDSLTYIWSAPEGTFYGAGDTVSWKAPKEVSRYPIYCRVEDNQGGYVEVNFEVQVYPNMLFSESAWTIYNRSNTDLPPYSIGYIASIAIDRDDQIWMGDNSGRLHKFDGTNWQISIFYIGDLDLVSIDIDANDHFWVISEGGHLIEFDGSNLIIHSRSNNHANNLTIDQDNNFWVAYSNLSGPSKYDGSNWENFDSLGLPAARDIAIDRQGDIWYTADSALVHYDHTSWVVIEGPTPQWSQNIAIDLQDRVWVATETHELALYDQNEWTYFPTPFEGNDGWINDLIIDADNKIWCACDGGIAILDGNVAQMSGTAAWQTVITPDNSPIPDGWITSLTIDSHGNIWGGAHAYGASTPGGGGLFKIDLFND